jgi:hypothetical protein
MNRNGREKLSEELPIICRAASFLAAHFFKWQARSLNPPMRRKRLKTIGLILGAIIWLVGIEQTTYCESNPPASLVNIAKAATPIKIDGVMSEGEWPTAARIELNHQVQPGDNTSPSERTEVYFACTREHLYIAFRAFDSNPSAIRARVGRREDIFNDDYVTLYLDTYFRSPGALTFVNTRQIVDPDWGVKLTGKIGANSVGILSSSDRAPGLRLAPESVDYGSTAHFNIFRYQRDILRGFFIHSNYARKAASRQDMEDNCVKGTICVIYHFTTAREFTRGKRFSDALTKQQEFINVTQALSPAVLLQQTLYALAGTDQTRYENFLRQRDEYHKQWNAYFNPKIFDELPLTSADYNNIPRFHFQEESFNQVLTRVVLPFTALTISALAITVVGMHKYKRYPMV